MDHVSSTGLPLVPGLGSPAVHNENAQTHVGGTELPKSAVVKTLWDEFTDQEKADCVGKLWEKKFNSQYRWDVKGRLRDEIWAQKTLPLLCRLEDDNFAQIHGAGNKHLMRCFHIALLSQTKDYRAANPAVLIIVDVKRIGQKMKRLFQNHQHFQDLNTGLRIEALDTSVL